jgi:hypothetical protein
MRYLAKSALCPGTVLTAALALADKSTSGVQVRK